MERSSRSRKTAELSESVHRQLSMYALAASAAGVGLLSLAQPVEAKIIYTPANEHVCATYLAVKQAAAGNGIADYLSVDGVRWASALKKGKRIGADGRFYLYGFIGSLANGSVVSARTLV
jgi:hypothetical protein